MSARVCPCEACARRRWARLLGPERLARVLDPAFRWEPRPDPVEPRPAVERRGLSRPPAAARADEAQR